MKTRHMALIALSLGLVGYLGFIGSKMGVFRNLPANTEVNCRKIGGIPGPEDIDVDPRTGFVYITSHDRRADGDFLRGRSDTGKIQGAIFRLRPGIDESASALPMDLKGQFRPHGFGIHVDGERSLIFAINHRDAGDVVEIFEILEDSLKHLETIKSDLFISLNDVMPVAPRKFYAGNDHDAKRGPGQALQDFTYNGSGQVLYFDGKSTHLEVDDMHYANGIAVSNDGKQLYVAETITGVVFVHDIDAQGHLSENSQIQIDSGIDNIDIDSSGRLLVGAHPKLTDFLKHINAPEHPSPSEVWQIDPQKQPLKAERIYLDDGKNFSGLSVAVRTSTDTYMGQVFGDYIFACPLK